VARGLPSAIEIVISQLAALTFAQDFGKPGGSRRQTPYFAPARRQWRGRIKFPIGDGVDRIGGLGQRARDAARNRQNRGLCQTKAASPMTMPA